MKMIECLCLFSVVLENKTSTVWVTEENCEMQIFHILKKVLLLQDNRSLEHVIMQYVYEGKGW